MIEKPSGEKEVNGLKHRKFRKGALNSYSETGSWIAGIYIYIIVRTLQRERLNMRRETSQSNVLSVQL